MTIHDVFAHIWEMLIVQVHGPLHLRFIMQPILGFIIAFRHGSSDARADRPPYFCGRSRAIRSVGLTCFARLGITSAGSFSPPSPWTRFIEFIVYRWIYPTQALITAAMLAFVPYLLLRGMVTRILESKEFKRLES